jgi:hypothetical protein
MPEPETTRLEQPVSRAFPWFCPKCRRQQVRPVTIPYHAERLHDGRVVSVDVPALVVPRCANCGELVFNYYAEEQILKALEAQVSSADPGGNGAGPAGGSAGPMA